MTLVRPASLALAVGAAFYLASLAVLVREPGFSLAEPLFLLVVLGIAFPLLAWALTVTPRRPAPADAPAQAPAVLLYLAAFAVLVLGWGFSALKATFPDDPLRSALELVVKLVTMVVLPLWLFGHWHRRRDGPLGARQLLLVFVAMSLAYLALQAVFGRGLQAIEDLGPSASTLAWAIPACWLWMSLEAGLA